MYGYLYMCNIYVYIFIYIRSAFNRVSAFFVQAFKIVVYS